MGKFFKGFFGALLAAIVVTPIETEAFADTFDQPVLVFQIHNFARVPSEAVENAKEYVQYIYRESGVQIEWTEADSDSPASTGRRHLTLTINLVSESMAIATGQSKTVTGFAKGNNGSGTNIAYVFSKRVERQADSVSYSKTMNKQAAEGLILGLVIAHEAGHLTLPFGSHTVRGIMSANIDLARVDEALRGRLVFNSDQGRLIRTALANESR